MQDISHAENNNLVSPYAVYSNTAKAATPAEFNDKQNLELIQSFTKTKYPKRNSANPSKVSKQVTNSDRVDNNSIIGLKRGQQSTTNKNTVSMTLHAPNQISSATNKIKKTFTFEMDETR